MHRFAPLFGWALLAAVIGITPALQGCREPSDPDQVGRAKPGGTEDAQQNGTAGSQDGARDIGDPPTEEEIRAAREQTRIKWDEAARGYIGSFEDRVYQPYRDSGLRIAEGSIEAEWMGNVARYSVRFDGERKPEQWVTVTPTDVPEAMPEGITGLVRRWAVHALAGASQSVLYYRPPVRYLLVPPTKGGPGIIVHCPPHRGDVGVSYRFDERELVIARGATSDTAREISYFDWEHFSGRYLLRGIRFHGTDSSVEFAQSDHEGVLLIDAVVYRKADASLTVRFAYDRIVATGPPDGGSDGGK